ncbi:hypothetical protein CAPTEDRAFT_190345 [Capitella teleta]|uniref:Uncharacterized protein n=1 Tax=Capitella teleta TaxID=283909 RepID=R7VDL3_CAPTE|nr:hypothetical protein CAPTEDRAFT_190345 [Capitella teleta]|eukprot:ELU13760.1 hypothetical protein CAPTEDRAFT_190345 [Capitella teleta]
MAQRLAHAPNPDSTPTTAPDEQLPIIYIVFIAFGVYIFIFVTGLVIRQLLMKRGLCANNSLFGKEGDPCCECCVACGESCNCFSSPSLEGCLDSICPARRTMSFSEIVQCRCCNDPNQQCCGCCGGEQPLCDCGNCDCRCNCQLPQCDNINCCCFQINASPSNEDLSEYHHQAEPWSTHGFQQPVAAAPVHTYPQSHTPRRFGNCNCQCGSTGCENCDCLCFSCKLKDPPPDEEDED